MEFEQGSKPRISAELLPDAQLSFPVRYTVC